MVSIIARMRRMNTLLGIRLGPGAAILSNNIKGIHLEFAQDNKDGHMGPRKFWRNCLPRLKYHNPDVAMTVSRHTNNAGPATLSIHFGQPESPGALKKQAGASDATDQASPDVIKQIDMKNKTDSAILDELLSMTGAVEVVPTEEEKGMLQDLQDQDERSQQDRKRSLAMLKAERKQAAILAQARLSVDATA